MSTTVPAQVSNSAKAFRNGVGARVVDFRFVAFGDVADLAGRSGWTIQELIAARDNCLHATIGKVHALRKQGPDGVQ